MFGKRGLIVGISLVFGILLAASVWGYGIQAVNKMITYPVDNEVYDYDIAYFNWTLIGTSHPLSSCYYNVNGGADIYFDCSLRTVVFPSPLADGAYSLFFFANNTRAPVPDKNEETVSFLIDTLTPGISFVALTAGDEANVSSSSITANVSVVEANPKNITFILMDSSKNVINTSMFSMADQNSNTTLTWFGLADGAYYYNVSIFDVAGHFNSTETRAIHLDDTYPLIWFTGATLGSGLNVSQNFVYAEVGVVELNERDIAFNLYNSSGVVDSQVFTNKTRNYNWASLLDGIYYYNVSVRDYAGNVNYTETRKLTLDTTAPVVELISPANSAPFEFTQVNQTLTYNVTENIALANCSLLVNGAINQTNYTLSSGLNNFSLVNLGPGKYVWGVSCWDYAGHSDYDERSFTILSNLTFPAGTNVTNLSAETNISGVWFWVMNEYGIINWTVKLDLSRGLDWAQYINLSFNRAYVDATGAPELNKNAQITLFNLSWSDPRILKDGSACSDCSEVSYVNNTFVFDVVSWGSFTTDETPSGGGGGGGSGHGISSRGRGTNISVPIVPKTVASVPETAAAPAEEPAAPSAPEQPGFFSRITGAIIGGGIASYAAVAIVLALIAGGYMALAAARRKKALNERVKILPDELDMGKHPEFKSFHDKGK